MNIADRIVRSGTCFLWTGAKSSAGYAQLRVCGKTTYLHRLVWELKNGPIPTGRHVLHKCDVRNCVNIKHLFLGTHQDNMRDMSNKRRHVGARPGERRAAKPRASRYTIRAIRKDPRLLAEIASQYGLSISSILNIRKGRSWKNVM